MDYLIKIKIKTQKTTRTEALLVVTVIINVVAQGRTELSADHFIILDVQTSLLEILRNSDENH